MKEASTKFGARLDGRVRCSMRPCNITCILCLCCRCSLLWMSFSRVVFWRSMGRLGLLIRSASDGLRCSEIVCVFFVSPTGVRMVEGFCSHTAEGLVCGRRSPGLISCPECLSLCCVLCLLSLCKLCRCVANRRIVSKPTPSAALHSSRRDG